MRSFRIEPVIVPSHNNSLHSSEADAGQNDLMLSYRIPQVAIEVLQPVLARYQQEPVWYMEKISAGRTSAPWAVIFFDSEYPIAEHLANARPADAGIEFAPYTALPTPLPLDFVPGVGVLILKHKDGLEKNRDKSPFFHAAWCALRGCPADSHYIVMLEKLSDEWVNYAFDDKVQVIKPGVGEKLALHLASEAERLHKDD